MEGEKESGNRYREKIVVVAGEREKI